MKGSDLRLDRLQLLLQVAAALLVLLLLLQQAALVRLQLPNLAAQVQLLPRLLLPQLLHVAPQGTKVKLCVHIPDGFILCKCILIGFDINKHVVVTSRSCSLLLSLSTSLANFTPFFSDSSNKADTLSNSACRGGGTEGEIDDK